MNVEVAAIILAAGMSSRFRAAGAVVTTKLVASYRGAPLVRHVAEAALASRARPVIVVTGHAASDVCGALDGLPLGFVHNAAFAEGLSGSLRVGLGALPGETAGALVLLGDMPAVTPRPIDALIARFAREPGLDAVVPLHQGRRGNPVLLGRALFEAAAQLEGDEGARRLLARAEVTELELDDPAVTLDVDHPSALVHLEGRQ